MSIIILILGGFVLYQFYRGYKQENIQITEKKENQVIDNNLSEKYKVLNILRGILKIFIVISVVVGVCGVGYFTFSPSKDLKIQILIILFTCFEIFLLMCLMYIIDFLFDLDKTKRDKD